MPNNPMAGAHSPILRWISEKQREIRFYNLWLLKESEDINGDIGCFSFVRNIVHTYTERRLLLRRAELFKFQNENECDRGKYGAIISVVYLMHICSMCSTNHFYTCTTFSLKKKLLIPLHHFCSFNLKGEKVTWASAIICALFVFVRVI